MEYKLYVKKLKELHVFGLAFLFFVLFGELRYYLVENQALESEYFEEEKKQWSGNLIGHNNLTHFFNKMKIKNWDLVSFRFVVH